MSKIYRNEEGYIQLVAHILENGVDIPDRTGVGCRAVFDGKLIFDTDVQFPFPTSRNMPLRQAFEEFWFFLNGNFDTKLLEAKGVNFWKGNTSREFLDQRGLHYVPEGSMNKAYGFQWRNAGGWIHYHNDEHKTTTWGGGTDQLYEVYNDLVSNPYSRRLYTTFWNADQSREMALTPCWHSHQFVVLPNGRGNNVLHLKLVNRSLDTLFGAYFAIQQYALYQKAMAQLLGMEVGKLSCDLTHIHLYQNQLEYAQELVQRDFGKPGQVYVDKELKDLDDLINLKWEDFSVTNLEVNTTPFKAKRPPMAV